MIDPHEFRNYMLLIRRAAELASARIDEGNGADAERHLRVIERLVRGARAFNEPSNVVITERVSGGRG